MPKNHYQYDVAFSYAGENEKLVRQIYGHLKAANVRVFFAPMRAGDLWGKDEREFQHVFGPASRFVMSFVSEDYVRKEWPRLEFRAARREARNRAEEFILPVRIDGAKLPGLRKKVQYIDARRYSARKIAQLFIDNKLHTRPPRAALVAGGSSARRGGVQILTPTDADLLGLIATAVFPLYVENAQSLLPTVNWRPEVARWRRQGFLQRGTPHLEVTPNVRRQLLARRANEKPYHERWIELLTPLRSYSDTALMLGLHYACLRRIREMLDVLTPVAANLEPGFWNDLYLCIFERFEKTSHLRQATAKARIKFHNTYGMVLSRNGRHKDALAQFAKLRVLSKRFHDRWGEGQSYINAGVAAAHLGDIPVAKAWYRKAADSGRRNRDPWLVGRALGNRANFEEPAAAARLLDQSEKIKRRVGDQAGLAGTLIARGNVAAALQDFAGAARYYRRAAALGGRLDLRYLRTLALRNLGRTEVDRGQPQRAFGFYREAQKIAEAERFTDELRHAVAGEALARMKAREYRRAETLFERIFELDQKRGDIKQAVVSLHDVGVMRMQQKRRSDAYATFMQVIDAARKAQTPVWVYRTQLDAAIVAPSEETAVALLRAARRGALRVKDHDRVVYCSARIAEWHLSRNDYDAALREIATALRVAPPAARLTLLADKFHIILETRNGRRLGAAFRALARAAEEASNYEYGVDAHMALGDYLWSKGTRDERVNGYQAYAAGMLLALRLSFETTIKVGSHAATKLHLLFREEDRTEILDVIECQTRRWLESQVKTGNTRLVAFALWPLRVARRILARPDFGRKLAARRMTRVIKEEIERGLGFSLPTRRLSKRGKR